MSEYTEAEERARAAILKKGRALRRYIAKHGLSADDPAWLTYMGNESCRARLRTARGLRDYAGPVGTLSGCASSR